MGAPKTENIRGGVTYKTLLVIALISVKTSFPITLRARIGVTTLAFELSCDSPGARAPYVGIGENVPQPAVLFTPDTG